MKALCLLLGFMIPTVGWAHSDMITKCRVPEGTVTKLGERVISSNGLLAEAYDINGDHTVDIVTFSPVTGSNPDGTVEHTYYPIFYEVDLNGDKVPDVIYVDKQGIGHCEDIVVYQDLREPGSRQPDRKRGGKL
jgi:hypothetical protein